MFSSKIRLSTLLIVIFCTQLGITVGLVGYLSLRSGKQAVEDVSRELSTEITRRIQERLKLHLEIPHLVNQFNANALAADIVQLNDLNTFQELLLRQVQAHEAINNTYVGTQEGDFFGAERNIGDGRLNYLVSGPSTDSILTRLDSQSTESGNPPGPSPVVLSGFDPRQRPWYQAAIAKGGPVWSEVYRDFSSGELTITASQPVLDEGGSIIGVLGSDFLFSANLNTFLRSLKIGQSGEAFILDRQGNLIATSTGSSTELESIPAERQRDNNAEEPALTQGGDQQLIEEVTQYLTAINQGSLTQIDNIQQLSVTFDQTPYFLQATPLVDDRGIDWLILVVIPKEDFLGTLQRSTQFIFLLCGAALLISSTGAVVMARKINRPLLNIIQATRCMVDGDLMQRVVARGTLETTTLATSFNQMAEQLQNSFAALSEKEERFRSLIGNIPGAIYRCRNDAQWTVEFLSDSIQDIVGYPATDFINNQTRTFASLIHPSDRSFVEQTINEAIAHKSSYQIEYRLQHRKGSDRWVIERGQGVFDINSELLYLDGAIFDITEQKKAQNILQEREKTIHAIVDAIPDLLIRTNIDGIELDVLGNAESFIERASLERMGADAPHKRVEEYLPPDLAKQRIDVIRTALQTNEVQSYEQYLQHPHAKHEEVRISPLNNHEALVIIRDITKSKRIEEALQELSAANRIQANMLPDYRHLCESISQIDLAAIMTPAKNVGGDFFDVFTLDHRYLCFSIGDVSGKGIPAALFMVRAMTLLRMGVDTGMPLNTSVSKVNKLLCINNLDCMFVTLFVGLLDVYTGEMRYVNCGHNPPFLCTKGSQFEILEPPPGILIGVFEEAEYEIGTLTLQKDDVLMLYTDGVTEAEDINHDLFSTERAISTLNSVGDRTQIQALIDTLQNQIRQFAQGMPQSDDITILALRYLGNENMDPEKYEEIELEWLVQNVKIDIPHKF